MPTKFSQFNHGGAIIAGDIVVGLRNGQDYQFDATALPTNSWQSINTHQDLVANTNYFMYNVIPEIYNLPLVCGFGETITIVNTANSTFSIAQEAGQQILIGDVLTTMGVGGLLTCTQIGDSLTLACFVPNLIFVVVGAPQGIWVTV